MQTHSAEPIVYAVSPVWRAPLITNIGLTLAILLLGLSLYLISRVLLRKSEKLSSAPAHVRYAPSFLKWIAVVAPLLTMMGGIVEVYAHMLETLTNGRTDSIFPYALLGHFLINLGVGIIVSLVALFGMALIFIKRIRSNEGAL